MSVQRNAKQRGKPFVKGGPNPGWKKGQSGNPGGTPKSLYALVRSKTNDGETLVQMLLDVADGKKSLRPGEELFPSIGQRLEAIHELLDRGWGKAPETLDMSVSVDDEGGDTDARAKLAARLVAALIPKPD